MFFQKLRNQFKWLIVLLAVGIGVTLLYVGVPMVGGTATTSAAVARVNGKDVSFEEYQNAYTDLVMRYQMMGSGIAPTDEEVLRFQALEMVINTKLILEAAKKDGIRVTKADIDAELENQKAMFPSEEEFQNTLQRLGYTERTLRAELEEQLLVDKVIDKQLETVEVSDDAIAETYEGVRASHILIRPETVDGEQDWEGALAKTNDILAQLKSGADFAELAAEHSEDGSAVQGGDLGMFGRGSMVAEFEEAAFSLSEGEISEPVRSQFGYHIIKVTERRYAEGEDFEEQKDAIFDYLRNQLGQDQLMEWVDGLRAAAKIEIRDPQLNAVQHVANGQLAQSITYYEEAIDMNPRNGYINFSLGRVYQMLGDTERALEQYRAATVKQPGDPQLHYLLASVLLDQEETDQAIEAFLAASEVAPNDFMLQAQVLDILSGLEATEEVAIVEQRIEDLFARMEQQQLLQEQQQLQQQQSQQDLQALLDEAARSAQEANE